MSKYILRCNNCNMYTLKETCPKCQSLCTSPKPVKFSPEDKYGFYRRAYKNDLDNKRNQKN